MMLPEEKTEALANLVHNQGYQILVEEMNAEVDVLEERLAYASANEEMRLLRLWQTTRQMRNILRDRPQEARQSVTAMVEKPSDEFDPMKRFDISLQEIKDYYNSKGIEWPPQPMEAK